MASQRVGHDLANEQQQKKLNKPTKQYEFCFNDSEGKEFACIAGETGSIPGSVRFPKKGMATHSTILSWRIPWTEEPGRLQSMGSQRV